MAIRPATDARSSALRQRLTDLLFLGLSQLAALLSSVGVHVISIHLMSPAQYASVGVLLLVSAGLQSLLSGGMPNAIRVIAASGGIDRLTLRTAARTHIIMCTVASSAIVMVGITDNTLGSSRSGTVLAALLSAELLVRTSSLDVALMLLNGLGRIGLQSALQLAFHVGRLSLFALATFSGLGTWAGPLGLLIAAGMASAMAWAAIRPQRMVRSHNATLADRNLAQWTTFGLHEVLLFVVPLCNLYVVRVYEDRLDRVAAYTLYIVALRAFGVIATSLSGVTFRSAVAARARGDMDTHRGICRFALGALAYIVSPIVISGVLESTFPMAIAGFKSRATQDSLFAVFPWIALALGIWSLFGELLAASGLLRVRALLTSAAALSGTGLSIVLATVWGCDGAAVGLLMTAAGGASAMLGLVRVAYGRFMPWSALGRIMIAGLAASVCIPPATSAEWTYVPCVARLTTYVTVLVILSYCSKRCRAREV